MLRLTIITLCLCFLSGRWPEESNLTPTKQILFIGNSLTYTNNLPTLVTQIAASKGHHIKTYTLASANYSLEDHWNDGKLQQLITKGSFDFVVVQQGPSSQVDGREILFDYGERIASLCEARGAKLFFFMVWPSKANYHTFGGVIKNYTDAAEHSGSQLCPVGKVWKDHFDSTNDFSYYGPDQFHPSPAGSKVAARIIYDSLFK